jgi:cytochrome P450
MLRLSRQLDPMRDPNRHLTFGHGIHFCLGASLARLETKVAIRRLLDQISGQFIIPENLERLPEEPFFFGVTSLPINVSLKLKD